MIEAKIILDSVSPVEKRLTTFVLTYPRYIHAEFMTHREFSRNASSSRAIPTTKLIEKVKTDLVVPVYWGKNQAGMVAEEELDEAAKENCLALWNKGRDEAIKKAEALAKVGVHKQIVNRLLEPYSHITVICSATEWTNFFSLRCAPDAQPEIRDLAFKMLREYYDSTPKLMSMGDFHMPFITEEDKDLNTKQKQMVSVARVARVSYLNHEGKRDIEKDYELYDRLLKSGHMSPFEHIATPTYHEKEEPYDPSHFRTQYEGNFKGWTQLRKCLKNEYRTNIPSRNQVEDYFKC